MGKTVETWKLKEGDIVRTDRGDFVLMWPAGRNRRGGTTIDGAYKKHLDVMLKNPKDTAKMVFYTITPKLHPTMEVVGKVSQTVVQKMRDMNALLHDVLAKKHHENMNKLDLKWNKDAVVKKPTPYGGTRVLHGTYDVVTQKGEHVKAGDLVMVKLNNGNFEMVMGNENGVVYDGKTGRFLCRSPWKVNRPPRMGLKYHPIYGPVPVKKKEKARSMPPESLLYLIRKKEDIQRGY